MTMREAVNTPTTPGDAHAARDYKAAARSSPAFASMARLSETRDTDAAIFAAIAAFDAADRAYQAVVDKTADWVPGDGPDPYDIQKCAAEDMEARATELAELQPGTLAAHAARAASVRRASERFDRDDRQNSLRYVAGGLVLAVLDDLAREAVPAFEAEPAGADAALIADCSAFDALEMQYRATGFNYDAQSPEELAADAERERIVALQEPIVTRIVAARATTAAGHLARARSLVTWNPDLVGEGSGDTGQRLLHALLRDLLGETAPPSDPDAELFRLVAEFETAHEAYWVAEEGDSAARDAAAAARIEASKALAAAKPATSAGHAARAAAALRCSGGFVPDNPEEGLQYLPPGLVLAVLRDLAGAVV